MAGAGPAGGSAGSGTGGSAGTGGSGGSGGSSGVTIADIVGKMDGFLFIAPCGDGCAGAAK
jgi:hypothetical protein